MVLNVHTKKKTKVKKVLIISVLLALGIDGFGQDDSIIYHQENSFLFSNTYTFYNEGTFEHDFRDDTFGIWFGTGTYSDKRNKRILKFGDTKNTFDYGIVHLESNFERILKKKRDKFYSKDYYGTSKNKYVKFEILKLK